MSNLFVYYLKDIFILVCLDSSSHVKFF